MIILSRKNHLQKFFLYNDLDRNIAIVVSNTGYNNNELSFYWLENFDKNTWKKKKKMWRMLVMDGTSSHIHEEFIWLSYSKNILSFQLLSHTIHLSQLLDVICF